MLPSPTDPSVCVLILCLNGQREIGATVRAYRELLPEARILVVDNCSTDATLARAREAGAEVLIERRRGKAQAVLSALPHVDADVLLLAPGDGRYPVEGARRLLDCYRRERPDMVVGVREDRPADPVPAAGEPGAWAAGAYAAILRLAFGQQPEDLGSELRLFSKFFYKNIPILLRGFGLELELAVQAADKNFRVAAVPVPHLPATTPGAGQANPSRLRETLRVGRFLYVLLRDYKPMVLFGVVAACFALGGLAVGSVSIVDFLTTGIVHRLSLPVLAASLMVIAFFTFQFGVVLESSLRYRRETYQTQLRRHYETAAPGPLLLT